MNFSKALELLKQGILVARSGWNGKGMYLTYVGSQDYMFATMLPFIAIKTVQGDFVPWVVSQTDLLAEDYVIVAE